MRAGFVSATACVMLTATGLPHIAWAQTYPTKPIRLIVAASAGSGADILARLMAPKLGEFLGQQFIVDNRPGAGGNIGAAAAARSAPDGYVLFLATPAHTISPALVAKPGYDLTRDFAPISLLTTGHYMLVTHPSVPARSVKELLALARAKPGGLTYGSAGTGNATHLSAEWMNILGQVKTLHVAYKGAGPARTDLLGGQIDFMFHNITAVLKDVESKRLRGLAVTGPARALVAPQVPTMAESGLAGYDITSWFGVAAPSATPPEVLTRLNKELVRVMGLAEIKQPLGGLGSEAVGSSAKVFGEHLRGELDKWQRVVKQAGIRAE